MKSILLDSKQIDNALTRLAHEIIENNNSLENICIIGIKSRGDVLAERIVNKILKITKLKVRSGYIDVTFYRDDFMSNLGSHKIGPSKVDCDINGLNIILIDDVLFSGRTIRASLDEINSFGRPSIVRLAVLIDRGHRELPIRADFVGKNIPTNSGEHVQVYLKETDEEEGVFLIRESN